MAAVTSPAPDPAPRDEKKTADLDVDKEKAEKGEAIPTDFQVKHLLQDSWTWWFDTQTKKSTQLSWGANLKKIYSFATVEDFWSLWNNIKGAHELAPGSDYHVFKEGINPMWEDKRNKSGGKWVLVLKNNQRKTQLNPLWLSALLAAIGASFDDDTQVNGIVVSLRKSMDKIALWTSDAGDDRAIKRIGEQFKALLNLPASSKISYMAHMDAMDNNSSYNNKPRLEL